MDGNGIQVITVGDTNLTAPLSDWLMAHPIKLTLVNSRAICALGTASTQESCQLIGHLGRSSMREGVFFSAGSFAIEFV